MKALLVDDHGLFRHGLELLMRSQLPCQTLLHAATAEQALALQHLHPDIDLVLLDYNLGQDLGLDVLARLKAADPALPVAMISGRDDPELIFSALGAGASGFLFKHMEPQDMLNALQLILDGGMFVPPSLLDKTPAAKASPSSDVYAHQVHQLADLARRVIREKNLNLRAQADIECEMTSAFNHLLAEFQQDRRRLAALAFNDDLTGLGNRRLFLERLDLGLKAAKRSGNPLALVYLDLDYFKPLNDTFGHAAGDALLKVIADRLAQQVRETDTVARIGGDEFTLILTEVQPDSLSPFIERLYSAIKVPVPVTEKDLWRPSASLGVALSQPDDTPDSLMKRADAVLYRVKQQGRDNFALG
jgi:diguanylate cyclase (GGDEF)-like protein